MHTSSWKESKHITKTCVISITWRHRVQIAEQNVPDTPPPSEASLVTVCATKLQLCRPVLKAISKEPLIRNTIVFVFCVLCLLACVWPFCICCNTTRIPERMRGAPCPNRQGQAVLTPHRRPFESFSVCRYRCSCVSRNGFVSVWFSFEFGVTHHACLQIAWDAFTSHVLFFFIYVIVQTFFFENYIYLVKFPVFKIFLNLSPWTCEVCVSSWLHPTVAEQNFGNNGSLPANKCNLLP